PEEARYEALLEMGGLEQRKEECRDMRRVNLIDNLLRDLKYAFRALARSPGFTAAAVAALALGYGAHPAGVRVGNGVLLRPLPYADPDRLVMIYDSYHQQGMPLGPGGVADFLDWKTRAHCFETLSAAGSNRYTLAGDGEAEQIVGMGVTASFFE